MMRALFARRCPQLCGVEDGFVLPLAMALPTDVACRDLATHAVRFDCAGYGIRLRAVCDHHLRVAMENGAACEVCQAGGEPRPLRVVGSVPIGAVHA